MRFIILPALFFFFSGFLLVGQSKRVIGYAGDGVSYKTRFIGDKFTVLRNEGYAIVNLEGKDLITGIKAPKVGFREVFSIDYGVFFSQEKDHIVLKNISGKILGKGKFQKIAPFIMDVAIVELKDAAGNKVIAYIDTTGAEVTRFDKQKYLSIIPQNKKTGLTSFEVKAMFLKGFLPFRDGLSPIQSDATDKFGFFNKSLKLVIPAEYSAADSFSEGLAAVRNNDQNWGYINVKGHLVIPYTYSRRPSRFSSGRAKVESKGGKQGYINKDNKLVIPAIYEDATTFYKGYALVRADHKSPVQLIDTTGKVVSTFSKGSYIDNPDRWAGISGKEEEDYTFFDSETLRQLVDHGKGIFTYGLSYGVADFKGNLILDFNYKYLADYHDGKMFAYWTEFKNNSTSHTYGIINDKGELIIEIVNSEF